MPQKYSLKDVVDSYRWLGQGLTELNAFHPEYRPGRENRDWNRERQAYPVVRYARSEREVVRFVEQYAGTRLVCYSINPRPHVLRNENGFVRAALDADVRHVQNLLLDLDPAGETPSPAQLRDLDGLLDRANSYFSDLGLAVPARARTGRGRHLLFALPAVAVQDCPDIGQRLAQFRGGFLDAYRQELDRIDVRLDPIGGIRRLAKVYGTAKPGGVMSRFCGGERQVRIPPIVISPSTPS
jgi:hypothetical protein